MATEAERQSEERVAKAARMNEEIKRRLSPPVEEPAPKARRAK